MIEINGVDKHFGEVKALDHIVASIHEGSIFGMVGTNGAGKSTLLRIMSGVLEPDAGNVLLDGEEVYENPKAKAKSVFCRIRLIFSQMQLRNLWQNFTALPIRPFPLKDIMNFWTNSGWRKKEKLPDFPKA